MNRAKASMWWFREGRKREREAICRAILRVAKAETNVGYHSLLNSVVQIIRGRKIREAP